MATRWNCSQTSTRVPLPRIHVTLATLAQLKRAIHVTHVLQKILATPVLPQTRVILVTRAILATRVLQKPTNLADYSRIH